MAHTCRWQHEKDLNGSRAHFCHELYIAEPRPEQAGKCCVGRLLASHGEASSPPRGCLTIAYAADSTIAQVLTCRYRLQGVQPLAPAPGDCRARPGALLPRPFFFLPPNRSPMYMAAIPDSAACRNLNGHAPCQQRPASSQNSGGSMAVQQTRAGRGGADNRLQYRGAETLDLKMLQPRTKPSRQTASMIGLS